MRFFTSFRMTADTLINSSHQEREIEDLMQNEDCKVQISPFIISNLKRQISKPQPKAQKLLNPLITRDSRD